MTNDRPVQIVKLHSEARSREDHAMFWIVLGAAGIGGALIVYKVVRPMLRRRRKYDAGAVSEYWIEQHRVRSQDSR